MKVYERTESLRKVRANQMVPGVIHGKSIESTSIQVEDKAFKEALKTYGKTMTFKVDFKGKKHDVYIQSVNSNILKPSEIIHFILHRISSKEAIKARIPIELIGKDVIYKKNLSISIGLSVVDTEYLIGHGIQKIEVDVTNLKLGDAIHVKDLIVDSNVKIKSNPEDMILMIKHQHVAAEEPVESEEERIEEETTTETKEKLESQ